MHTEVSDKYRTKRGVHNPALLDRIRMDSTPAFQGSDLVMYPPANINLTSASLLRYESLGKKRSHKEILSQKIFQIHEKSGDNSFKNENTMTTYLCLSKAGAI